MVIAVPRARWTPQSATDEQNEAIDAIKHAFRQGQQWDKAGYAAIRYAQSLGVPIEWIAADVKEALRIKISPATIYRHIGEADDTTDAEPGIVSELAPSDRAAVQRELAAHGWTARDFLLASFAMLLARPEQYLGRLAEIYPRRKRPRR